MLALTPTRLFTGSEMLDGHTVHIREGQIVDVTKRTSAGAIAVDGLLAPGFIDVQVNGGGGVLFNNQQSVDVLRTIASAHARFGVTGFMATLISDDRTRIVRAIDAVTQAIESGTQALLGLHLEGPWLSASRRGVHPSAHLRPVDEDDIRLLTQKRSFPILVTVAPEQVDVETIRTFRSAGVIVSLGHTEAPAELVEAALSAGATGFTHLFNAMPPLEGRKPGPVGAALANRDCWAGLILDGIHVSPISARAAFAAKTARRLMLVSDAMATIGSENALMSLFGEAIEVRDGALRTAGGTLAGAHLDLSAAVRNAVSLLGATPAEALQMASLAPAEFLGVASTRGRVDVGCRADLVLLDEGLNAKATWIAGKQAS
ncbi:MAG TPA: N-acetylglucosamine-6-phosphate deacetylase [Hyphomonadaceae bacterium]|nr:N-acetylglucosamine-6-phosphate deacetylase [Hyphomonadaceae bacterium]